jgi:hypothetical protein
MKRFRYLIGRHEDEYGKLHAMLWETFGRRDKSELAWHNWQLAAKRFREYRSEVDELVERCLAKGIADDNELRIFVFCFVECDPYYHRSGYTLEGLLRKIIKAKPIGSRKIASSGTNTKTYRHQSSKKFSPYLPPNPSYRNTRLRQRSCIARSFE